MDNTRPDEAGDLWLAQRLAFLETAPGPVTALEGNYPDGQVVAAHVHTRSQLLYAMRGVVMVSTDVGRWMVPPEHSMWIPAGIRHSVEMIGDVQMRSLYLDCAAAARESDRLAVLAMSDLMRALIALAVEPGEAGGKRRELALQLIVAEVPCLDERPLALPLPADARLARLCRAYVAGPTRHATIDAWAGALGMSRRAFTRFFLRETGLGLSTWRQQACLLAALPRLSKGEPVTTVAIDLGYSSVPAFTTMFTRMLGVPPRAYFRRSAG